MSRRYHIKNIRALLNEGFTAEELRRVCYDAPDFRPVYDQFTLHTSKDEIIDRLIVYAEDRVLFDLLLSLAKEYNPARYEQHLPYYAEELIPTLPDRKGIGRFISPPLVMAILAISLIGSALLLFFILQKPKIKAAEPGEILALVAEFDNLGDLKIRADQRIFNRLEEEVKGAQLNNVRIESIPKIGNLKEAKEVGQIYGSAFVIWGWTDDVGIVPNFSITDSANDYLVDASTLQRPLDLGDFNLFVAYELPDQLTFLATFTVGQIYFRDKNYQEAHRVFKLALQNQPKNFPAEALANVYFYRGLSAQNLRDFEDAKAQYNQAVALFPSFYQAYYNRGVININQHLLPQAITDFDQAITFNKDLTHAYINRGYAYKKLEKWAEALADFNQALALEPTSVDALLDRGVVYQKTGNLQQALVDYNRVIELAPDFPIAYLNRANIYEQESNYEQAIADYQKALELDSQKIYNLQLSVQLALAWAYYEISNYPAAIETNRQALDNNLTTKPGDPDFDNLLLIRYNLALALLANGQLNEATHEYETALSFTHDPTLLAAVMKDIQNLMVKQPQTTGAEQILQKLSDHKL